MKPTYHIDWVEFWMGFFFLTITMLVLGTTVSVHPPWYIFLMGVVVFGMFSVMFLQSAIKKVEK